MKRTWIALLLVMLLFGGCSDSDDDPVMSGFAGGEGVINLGVLMEAMQNSVAPDGDGDGIPDDVETGYLGTDKAHANSDRDGMPDYLELYAELVYDPGALLPDADGDGLIAPLDADDDGDGVHDGEKYDNDGDGIPNYLEIYGYVYDWMSGSCLPWDGCSVNRPYYKTDPDQRSTDQDPFDDLLEVSGRNMDVSIETPGKFPMVPATPEIVVRLMGCSITLDQDIEYAYGESLEKGSSWSTTNEISREVAHEWHVDAGLGYSLGREYTFGFDGTPTVGINTRSEVSLSASAGYSQTTSSATTLSQTAESHEISVEEWSRAVTGNPAEAARVKLFLKVFNQGTACASNIRPTLTLKIGGRHVATFSPESQVGMLEPGAGYPQEAGVYWVVDRTEAGEPLRLTLQELRDYECGVPVSVTVTQVQADVMKLDRESGDYVNAGDWNNYMARCRAVCADLYLESGDGNLVHRLVYADERPAAPQTTLLDAFHWGVNEMQPEYGEAMTFTYRDVHSGERRTVEIDGWHFSIDPATLAMNGIDDPEELGEDFNVARLRLGPRSVIHARAPRDPDVHGDGPIVYYAFHDVDRKRVVVCVTDYDGVASVSCSDGDGEHTLNRLYDGALIYEYVYTGDEFSADSEITVRVVNHTDGETEAAAPPRHSMVPPPEAPVVTEVSANINNGKISAVITSGRFGLVWVRVRYPDGGLQDLGFMEAPGSQEDNRRWVCTGALASGTDLHDCEHMEILVMSESGLSVVQGVSGIGFLATGKEVGPLFFEFAFSDSDKHNYTQFYHIEIIDLDSPGRVFVEEEGHEAEYHRWESLFEDYLNTCMYFYEEYLVSDLIHGPGCDLMFFYTEVEQAPDRSRPVFEEKLTVRFDPVCQYAIVKGRGGEFNEITRDYIENQTFLHGDEEVVGKGDMILVKTTEGRSAKVLITQLDVVERVCGAYEERKSQILVKYQFETFRNDEDF